MKSEKLIILQRELDLLKTHLMHSNLSSFNKDRLLEELRTAQIVTELPEDVVCLNSHVEIQEVVTRQKFTFQIVLPAEANMRKNRISVFAPIGVALLGYKTGAQVQWEMPNGLKTFVILTVTHKDQYEAIKEEDGSEFI